MKWFHFHFLTTKVTWQWDALLVARFPLTILVHSAALAAGFLVAHVWGVVLGANFILPYGSLGEKAENNRRQLLGFKVPNYCSSCSINDTRSYGTKWNFIMNRRQHNFMKRTQVFLDLWDFHGKRFVEGFVDIMRKNLILAKNKKIFFPYWQCRYLRRKAGYHKYLIAK